MLRSKIIQIWTRAQSTSALYITRDKATSINAFVTPHLEFDFPKITQSIQLRKLNINMPEIIALWDMYKEVETSKINLEKKKEQISENIKQNVDNVESLKLQGKMVREQIKIIKERICELEKTAVLTVLDLPNLVDPNVPGEDTVYYKFKEKPEVKGKFHLDVSKNLIEYYSPQFYYLKNEAAELELHLMDQAAELFNKNQFIASSNPDFAQSLVIEGCGQNDVYTLQNGLHLVGGSSVIPFMAYHTKNLLFSSTLPLKYYNIGRSYIPVSSESNGLFNVSQSTNFDIFLALKNCPDENMSLFQTSLKLIIELYENLGYHFRVVYKSPVGLHKWESFRADIEMFSTSTQVYIPVGYLSMSDSYFSKRLMFCYSEDKIKCFPKIIYGNVINYPKFLGCILEQKVGTS